ncbi:MAG: GNAT family N-acetyltransferase [Anaerolineae bacterium]|nr:GNAT family N-acetyltransferase [Anaerolineae bacterium]
MTHLDWRTPEEWLADPAITVCAGYDGREAVAVMATSVPEEGVCWLRVLAVGRGISLGRATRQLWSCLASHLRAEGVREVYVIVLAEWAHYPLLEAGFRRVEDVILLERAPDAPLPPQAPRPDALCMIPVNDGLLGMVKAVDRATFAPCWRLDTGDLQVASRQAAVFLLAEVAGRPAGYALVTAIDGEAHLARLATAPVFQRCGVATALLHEAVPVLRAAGLPLTTVNTQRSNQASRQLYARWGFRETGFWLPVLAASPG